MLERTNQNLLRVADVIEELKTPAERQAPGGKPRVTSSIRRGSPNDRASPGGVTDSARSLSGLAAAR